MNIEEREKLVKKSQQAARQASKECDALMPSFPIPEDLHYEEVMKRVEALATIMLNEQISSWLVPKCPQCDGLLSLYCFTQKLICLKCQNIYALGLCGKDKQSMPTRHHPHAHVKSIKSPQKKFLHIWMCRHHARLTLLGLRFRVSTVGTRGRSVKCPQCAVFGRVQRPRFLGNPRSL